MNETAPLAEESAPVYPMPRVSPVDPPPPLAELRAGKAASRVTLWDGSQVWLVTSHAGVKAVLGDRRFTAVTSAPGFPMLTRISQLVRAKPASASFIRMDDPEHSRLRSMLTRDFLARRAEALRPAVRELLDEMLAKLVTGERPVDLVAGLAIPVPSRVITLLFGAGDDRREFIESRSAILVDRGYTPDQVAAARDELDGYLRELVEERLADPGDDLISRLVLDQVRPGKLSIDEMVPMCRLLLVAGHGTTTSQAGLGLLSLITDPGLTEALAEDPGLMPKMVEELLRFHSIVQNGLARAATEDVELDDVVIRAGEGVVLSLSAANRDEQIFPDPDRLDPHRDARRHFAFGHGMHQCLGQWLARVELEEIYAAVLRWMPGARLAIPFEELEFRHEVSSYGLGSLPVTW
ncbi:cytochrome P450 [Streptomyces katsurahamanus]|uniref:Cytochrome P450 n=2 Tax=Streptomyces TaxID=1883 RepID=A0A646KK12_STRJU|nr:cytochrome P450 [Streptomyces katsurahamanus]MQT02619.1 cytochrome P450 [Streptomyces jumonjinensis]